MTKTRKRPQLDTLPPERLEHIAENMKERIYATLTLLAVIAALWQTAQHHTAAGAIASIVGSVAALWLATIISARMSYRAVHAKRMSVGNYRKIIFTSSGLFAPAIAPVLFILVSLTGLFSLGTALVASMITLALSLFLFSFIAGRRIYGFGARLLVISSLEMLLGIGVIALKLAVGE
jgi:hypothetical protein